MPQVRARKILTFLDSSGNNLIVAERVGSRSASLENRGKGAVNLALRKSNVRGVNTALENQNKGQVNMSLEPQTNTNTDRQSTKNDSKGIRRVRKNAQK